jgi:hypothetical protein
MRRKTLSFFFFFFFFFFFMAANVFHRSRHYNETCTILNYVSPNVHMFYT